MLRKSLTASAAILALAATPVFSQQSAPNSQPSSASATKQPSPASATNQPATSQAGTSNPQTGSSAPAPSAGQPSNKADGMAQPGVRTVTGTSVRLDFYAVGATDIRASDLIGMNVYNLNNESVGEVEDLVLDNGKNVKGIVLSVGGFLGLGERHVAVQPGSVMIQRQADGAERAVINTNKETLKNAPEFKF
jgi:sporulation protein YlmC with PRC-barrel domain